jgi:hypothetical protein
MFGGASVLLLACAILWPAGAEGVLHSRLAAEWLAAWCAMICFLVHPELSTWPVQAIHDFRQAVRDFEDDIGKRF